MENLYKGTNTTLRIQAQNQIQCRLFEDSLLVESEFVFNQTSRNTRGVLREVVMGCRITHQTLIWCRPNYRNESVGDHNKLAGLALVVPKYI